MDEEYCTQCGELTEQFFEGYCSECCDYNQKQLDDHNHSFDKWHNLNGEQRDLRINNGL